MKFSSPVLLLATTSNTYETEQAEIVLNTSEKKHLNNFSARSLRPVLVQEESLHHQAGNVMQRNLRVAADNCNWMKLHKILVQHCTLLPVLVVI